jgi:hypothetical protein
VAESEVPLSNVVSIVGVGVSVSGVTVLELFFLQPVKFIKAIEITVKASSLNIFFIKAFQDAVYIQIELYTY